MKVLLRRNVSRLGVIGEIVEVKTGYARNYLLPSGLGVAPTPANLKIIESEKKVYLEEVARQREAMQAQARVLEGKEFTIVARANEEGHLYGSVGPAQVAQAIAKEGLAISDENVALDEPIRKLDRYDVTIRFTDDVTAKVVLWVVPPADQQAPPGTRLPGSDEQPPAADNPPPAEDKAE